MTRKKRALITGIAGQDGSYLAEFLLGKNYDVHGLVRRPASHRLLADIAAFPRLEPILEDVTLHWGDLLHRTSLEQAVGSSRPDEIYNLAAAAFVPSSLEQPDLAFETNAAGTIRLIDVLKVAAPSARLYHASTSEMYGDAGPPQDEDTSFRPQNHYARSKLTAHEAVIDARETNGLFCCCGIAFNHESPRRDLKYVSRAVTHGVARIKLGLSETLTLGNLNARRDWGFAGDYVKGMWKMLQMPSPDDFVLATGVTRSVEELAELAFALAGVDSAGRIESSDQFRRPSDSTEPRGDASKAWSQLKWKATTPFEELIQAMLDFDTAILKRVAPHETVTPTA